MMELKVSEWKEFRITRLFSISAGKYYSSDDYEIGETPYVSASASNNGVIAYIDKLPDFEGNQIVTGKVESKAFYQKFPFCATSDANVFTPLFAMSEGVGLFFAAILSFNEQGKWGYGRQCRIGDSEKIILRLPIQHDAAGQPVIDPSRKYSDDGYVPDWDFMEQYMKSLNTQPLVTQRGGEGSALPTLGVDRWKEFLLNRICKISMGNKFDNDKMSHENPTINFVSRTAENNGIADFVDVVNGVCPYDAGSLTVALGGSIGSCFLQKKPFYTGQNVAVLEFDSVVSDMAKLFLSTLFMHECRSKFVAFGRELNTHIRTDLTLFLPVQHDAAGQPMIDPSQKYSDDGYIPDWAFMEQYIGSLPGSDLI